MWQCLKSLKDFCRNCKMDLLVKQDGFCYGSACSNIDICARFITTKGKAVLARVIGI